MATTAALAAAMMALTTTANIPAVVVHVTDYAQVSGRTLETAEQLAGRAYAKIGVPLRWADGSGAAAAADGSVHLDVVILDAGMTTRRHAPPDALGQGRRESRRAAIYYGQITDYALRTRGDVDLVLALALAHEIGHMLLPEYSHSRFGLMRPTWTGRIVEVPDFLPAQAAAIRTLLLADTSHE